MDNKFRLSPVKRRYKQSTFLVQTEKVVTYVTSHVRLIDDILTSKNLMILSI